MKKKRSSKLTLNRETLKQLDRSDLRTVAGATAQIGCPNTFNSCKGICETESCVTCLSCGDPTCNQTQACPTMQFGCNTTLTQ